MVDGMGLQLEIADDDAGATVQNEGILNSITIVACPSGYKEYLTLVDDAVDGYEIMLFNCDISSSHVSVGSYLMSDAEIPFMNLTVKNIPKGSIFSLNIEPSAREKTDA